MQCEVIGIEQLNRAQEIDALFTWVLVFTGKFINLNL